VERWGLAEAVTAVMAGVLLVASGLIFGRLLTAPPLSTTDPVIPTILWLLGVVAAVFLLLGVGLGLLLWRSREP
jgi:hypothetical protein